MVVVRAVKKRQAAIPWKDAIMNQAELQQMADARLLDAAVLIAGRRWEFAYYAAGYSVECALKSCVLARMIHTGGVFDDDNKNKNLGTIYRTHKFMDLVKLAGLDEELNAKRKASSASGGGFVGFWGIVEAWEETSRYKAKTEAEAKSLYEAIDHNPDGVLRWIRNYW
jgi:hypothetical protein